ncbi:hypothetical protein GCM10009765_23530 [Fodinicola feengrottensis]|uniref:Uncharacterized protein n=1 Tax=Fodinicola feengrottensis TaxID=435914 RepID=A0ABN2GM45_9ACTN
MYPQSGDAAAPPRAGVHGVPREWQVSQPPSPIDQLTATGRAVAVTVKAGTLAVAVWVCHESRLTHSHTGNRTSFTPVGLAPVRTAGN